MRNCLLTLLLTIVCQPLLGQQERLVLKAYGEMNYSYFDYGPDQKSGENGSQPDSRATVDVTRFVPELKFYFDSTLYGEFELEIEHGGTGAALELEYEEFGEYEFEVEKGGEILVEQFHLTKVFSPSVNLRIGHFIVPVGLLNRFHKPTEYFTAARSEAETSLIPVTWHETGLTLFGNVSRWRYQAGIVNGLDATGFSSKFWVAGGHQTRFEQARATDLAVFLRVDFKPFEKSVVGFSAYRGNSTGNRPKNDMDGIDGNVSIAALHGVFERGAFTARGQYLYGHLQNADEITQKNSRLSVNLEVPRTPVAKNATTMMLEAGVDLLSLMRQKRTHRLLVFGHYSNFDSMADVNEGIFADPRFQRQIISGGLNFFWSKNIVVKAEYSHRTLGDSRFNDENTFSLSLGFSGELFKSYFDE